MPYYITNESPDCSGWATVKEDGEVLGCHTTKQAAIDQMVAVSIAEGMEPGGERKSSGVVETRHIHVEDLELRNDGMSFVGYAAVFNKPSEPLPFTERIAQGAFSRTLSSRNNIKMFVNHNDDLVLASTRANTLRLAEDSRGLRVDADLPATSYGRDLSVLMQRGDVDSMSFGFSVPRGGDSWSEDGSQRTLNEVRLHEVSVVTGFPAYTQTSAKVRNLGMSTRSAEDIAMLEIAVEALLSAQQLPPKAAELLLSVINKMKAIEEAEMQQHVAEMETIASELIDPTNDGLRVDVLKQQLELAYKAV